MPLLLLLVLLQAPGPQTRAPVTSDTIAVLRALGAELQAKLQAPITVQLDTTTCEWSAPPSCDPGVVGVPADLRLEPLLGALGEKGRNWSAVGAECSGNYESGPFDLLVRLPRFDVGHATVLVTMMCAHPRQSGGIRELFAKGEAFEFRFEGSWRLVERHLIWIT